MGAGFKTIFIIANQDRELAMTIQRSTLKKLAFSTFLLTLPLNAAFAADPAVAERIKAALGAQGVDISWTGVSEIGRASCRERV